MLALLLVLSAAPTLAQPDAQAKPYRNPIVFARTHYDADTGTPTRNAKIWIMEEDGSRQRQLTVGPQYDDHPTLFAD